MIRNKDYMTDEQALSLGFLSPATGVAAMQALLHDLAAAAGPRVAGTLGVATQTYWRLLLAKVKPLPHFFSQLDFAVEAARQVRQDHVWGSGGMKSSLPCGSKCGRLKVQQMLPMRASSCAGSKVARVQSIYPAVAASNEQVAEQRTSASAVRLLVEPLKVIGMGLVLPVGPGFALESCHYS